MSNELSKELVCILMRSGVQIWAEKDRVEPLRKALNDYANCPQFINYDGEDLNKADISGIYSVKIMDELTRRKNGQWQCKEGYWHDRGEKCEDCWVKNAQKRAEEHRRINKLGEYANT